MDPWPQGDSAAPLRATRADLGVLPQKGPFRVSGGYPTHWEVGAPAGPCGDTLSYCICAKGHVEFPL